jgi:glycerate kinase
LYSHCRRLILPEVVLKVPIADGGEGTVDSFLAACGGKKVGARVKDPLFREIDSFYGILPDGKTVVIEMAAVGGS